MHYSARGYFLTVSERNYLLAVLAKSKLTQSGGKHFFVGTTDELKDILDRLKGLYDYYNELPAMLTYYCSMERSLKRFRELVNPQPVLAV